MVVIQPRSPVLQVWELSHTIGLAYGQGSASGGNHYSIYNEYDSSGNIIGQETILGTPPNTTLVNGKYYLGLPAYSYGMMTGASKGDSIAYSIQVPGNPSQVWNSGEHNYTSTATGENEVIPIVVTLQPAQTPNQYPSADTYMDIVTATINY